jgi:formylmethanofuran dehydrogenase subunit B
MIIKDVVCPFCGCLCDDLDVEVDGQNVIKVQNGCALAESTLMGSKRLPAPIRRTVTGWQEMSYDDAIRDAIYSWPQTAPCSMGGAAPMARPRAWAFTSRS